jgi:hypothetical protein
MMGRFVIVAYTPKTGQGPQLLAAVKKHLEVLQAEQLVTDRPAYVMRAGRTRIQPSRRCGPSSAPPATTLRCPG